MRIRHCKRIFYVIPDRHGLSIRMAELPRDWSLSGIVAHVIGRVWADPDKRCSRCDGPLRGRTMFCPRCQRDLETEGP